MNPTVLRTPETYTKYKQEPSSGSCFMCDPDRMTVIEEFKYFLIIENNFPYDAVAELHHMLIPKRHTSFVEGYTPEEQGEFDRIQTILNERGLYDCILTNFTAGQSQPQHVHNHLLRWYPVL